MKHHIEKMIVDMYVSDKEKAQKLQSKVSQLFNKDLEKITENILSEFSTEDTTIHVNQLEIDLGDIRSDYFMSDFIKAYKNALRYSIKKLLVNKNAYSITQQETIQITTKSTEASILEILFFFLSFGRLPNNAPKDFNLNIAFLELLNKQKSLTIQRIQPLLKQRGIVHRIVYSFPEKTIELFLKQILPNQYKRINTAIDNVNSIFNSSQFSTDQQKVHKKLLLLTFELIQQNYTQKNTLNIDLETLNKIFLELLPEAYRFSKVPIYETNFTTIQVEKFNISKTIQLSVNELKKLLRQAEKRQFIINNGTKKQLESILQKLIPTNYSNTLQTIIQQLITEYIDTQNDTKNIVWSTVFDILSKKSNIHKFPNLIRNEVQKNLRQGKNQLREDNKLQTENTQNKTPENQEKAKQNQKSQQENAIEGTELDKDQNKTLENQEEAKQNQKSQQENAIENIIILTKRAEDILEIYLMQGYFIQQINLDELIRRLLMNEPQKLRFLLNRIGKNSSVQERLTATLSIENLEKIINLLIPNPQFIHNLRAVLDKTHQRILLQIAIQHYLKYGKIDNLVLFNDLIKEQETEISSIQLFEAITESVQDETIINLIKTYETIEIVINPEVEKQFDEIFDATRYLDYFYQYFEINSTTDWWTNQISKEDLNQNFQTVLQIYPTIIQDIITNLATPKKLLELLNENNLTILMNLLEPSTFGFITTIILTIEKISNRKNAWEIALKTYFNTSKPLDADTFTRQSFLRLAKYANKSYQEITKEVIQYSDEQIKNKQHRYFALKHILQQDIRIKRTPELLLETLESKRNNETIIEHTETSLPIEIIAYFLKYGTLPNTQKKLTEVNMIQLIKKQGIENLNLLKITIQKLLNNTISNNQLKHLPEPIFIELIKTLQPKVGSSVLEIYNDFKMVVEVGILKISMLEVIQDTTIFNTKSNFAQRYIHHVLTNLATNFNYTYASALIAIIDEFDGKNPTSNIIKQLRRINVKIKQQEQSNTIEDKPVPVVERTITPLKNTAIYIDNAGIVILSVFLPHLFNMFKLIENKKFKDIEASCRAAYMIHYISTGRTQPMEHELVLCKIICNIPLGQPINAVIILTEEEKEGCKQLMKAAIGRWEKVKNSSIEGFRNSFVAREGKLVKTSKGWSLAVEQKPFDLLLKSLPWGIGMVRFGWMDQPVFVDWAY